MSNDKKKKPETKPASRERPTTEFVELMDDPLPLRVGEDEKAPIPQALVEVNNCPVCGSLFDGVRCVVDGYQSVRP